MLNGQPSLPPFGEISLLLSRAKAETSPQNTRRLLEAALKMSIEFEQSEYVTEAVILKARIFAQLAVEERTARARTAQWKKSMATLEALWKKGPQVTLADAFGLLTVDCYQDVFSDLDLADRQKFLRTGRDCLDHAIDHLCSDSHEKSNLLARKSSILRQLAMSDVTRELRTKRFAESLGCARRAVELSKNQGSLLELGLSEWAVARYQQTDELYAATLRSAEKHLKDSARSGSEIANLSILRFYRLTFRPLEACDTLQGFLSEVTDRRRLLRDGFVYAEACIQLWYHRYPDDVVQRHLVAARDLLEAAVVAGYQNARTLTDLAYVVAIMDGAVEGGIALNDICASDANISWDEAARLVAEADLTDPAALGFALGINQSAVWTLLGTFAWNFKKDQVLAEALYRYAVRLDAGNPVALTNLARFLIDKDLKEASRLVRKAGEFADRRFTWWRTVKAEIETKESPPPTGKQIRQASRLQVSSIPGRFQKFKDLSKRFRLVQGLADHQQRGFELERLFYDLANLTVGMAAPPYRIPHAEGGMAQIDGYFEHRGYSYRVECKWTAQPIDRADVALFSDKLEVVGVSGLFVSMSGFTEAAVGGARSLRGTKAILLMDGDEAQNVFNQLLNFDELMTRKQVYFYQRSEPYHRVTPLGGTA
jgi:hypothetical protein